MYYIYHIIGIKVGCTRDLKRRVEQEQGYKKYSILFKSDDISRASKAERYYQKLLSYKIDPDSYEELINKKQYNTMLLNKTSHTTTFKVSKEKLTKQFMLDLIVINDVNGTDIIINEELANWMLKNLKQSQFSNEMFLYNQSLVNAYEFLIENTKLKNENNFDNIRNWAEERGLYKEGDSKTQYIKLQEEAGELARAILKKDKEEVIDAIGDIVVVLTNLAHLEGLKIEDCITAAYNVIKKRQGSMVNGTFVKN
jgi:NTP pyrophosphatase (non-canonical NTP hydrolase)